MLTLAINTTMNFDQLVLFDDGKILVSKSWISSKQESDSFIQKIDEVLNSASRSKHDIARIFVLSGHGNFTSLRVGIVIANAFAYGLGVPIFSLNLFDFVKATNGFDFFDAMILNARKGEIFFVEEKGKRKSCLSAERKDKAFLFENVFAKLKNDKFEKIVVSLNDLQMEKIKNLDLNIIAFPFSDLLLRLDFEKLKEKGIVEAEYFREAL